MNTPLPWCDICESHHEPTCGKTYAEGLLKLTSAQYFALVEGVPMPVADEDEDAG
jgi:hypothetical protein